MALIDEDKRKYLIKSIFFFRSQMKKIFQGLREMFLHSKKAKTLLLKYANRYSNKWLFHWTFKQIDALYVKIHIQSVQITSVWRFRLFQSNLFATHDRLASLLWNHWSMRIFEMIFFRNFRWKILSLKLWNTISNKKYKSIKYVYESL